MEEMTGKVKFHDAFLSRLIQIDVILYSKFSSSSLFEGNAPKQCTFSSDDPKTSMELNCSVEMRMAKGAFSIRSLFGEFLLLAK